MTCRYWKQRESCSEAASTLPSLDLGLVVDAAVITTGRAESLRRLLIKSAFRFTFRKS
jgi:hypothetical protein